tara:strand:- start:368 stop:967 length:600 start_codon:yes stop_codon:yes gene_type:complete
MSIIKLNNQSISAITSLPAAIPTGALVHIKTQSTAGSVSSVSFVHGSNDVVFDNTYKYYIVRGQGIRMDTSGQNFVIKFSENTGSSYSDSDGVEKYNSAKSGATGNSLQYRSAARITGQGLKTNSGFAAFFELTITNASSSSIRTYVTGYCGNTKDNDHELFASYTYKHGNANATDAFQIATNSGVLNAGSISLYGVVT